VVRSAGSLQFRFVVALIAEKLRVQPGTHRMIKIYRDADIDYLAWIEENPSGYVVNTDDPPTQAMYPMVHSARHRVVSSESRTNYTTGRYVKYCALDLEALERFVQARHNRALNFCKVCMRRDGEE
jgi:hypothetical protein